MKRTRISKKQAKKKAKESKRRIECTEWKTIFRRRQNGGGGVGAVNHWVHMDERQLINTVPGLLMIPAGKQASHSLERKKRSPQ